MSTPKRRHKWEHQYGLDHIESACRVCLLKRLRQTGMPDQYSKDGIVWMSEPSGVPPCEPRGTR